MPASSANLDDRWEDRRADARRNRERVIAAALEAYAERGLNATVPDIAARAGVGKATVYRSFPAKHDLLTAVAIHLLRQLRERVNAAAAEPDSSRALAGLVTYLFRRLRTDQMTAELLRSHVIPAAETIRRDIRDIIERLIQDAKSSGNIRPDATVDDLDVLVAGCALRLHQNGIVDLAAWDRQAELVLSALRPAE